MPRPVKNNLDSFPTWCPQQVTSSRMGSRDFRVRYKAIRNSSSSFIKRKDVREAILKRDDCKCTICGSKENLTIDHIISVYSVALKKYPLDLLNRKDNLRSLCLSCNCRKAPL